MNEPVFHYRTLEKLGGGGMGVMETAEALRISTESVQRDWDLARGWLYRELCGNKQNE